MQIDADVILNPTAGRGRALRIANLLRDWAHTSASSLRWHETAAPGEGIRLAAELKNPELVISIGGDGTHREVLNGLTRHPALPPLALLPGGTGNDMVRALNMPVKPSFEFLANGLDRHVDMAKSTNGFWMNVAGMGFDAMVARRINRGFRFAKGQIAYLLAIVSALREYQPISVSMNVDGESIERRVMLCAVANAQSYGGGLKIAPQAQLDDGELNLVIVGDISKAEFLKQFPRVYRGGHLGHPAVESWPCRTVSITGPASADVLYDGELGPAGRLSATTVPGAVRLRVPK